MAGALGCELTAGGTIVTDGDGRTTVDGVYAAGDAATDRLRSVAAAIGTGSRAALALALDHMAVAAATLAEPSRDLRVAAPFCERANAASPSVGDLR